MMSQTDSQDAQTQMVKCSKPACEMHLPSGYTSPRGYCATCEYKLYQKILLESIERTETLATIYRMAKRFGEL